MNSHRHPRPWHSRTRPISSDTRSRVADRTTVKAGKSSAPRTSDHVHSNRSPTAVTRRCWSILAADSLIVFNAAQDYSEPWIANAGGLEATVEVGMTDLILLDASITGVGSGGFRIDEELRSMRSGAIANGLSGDGDIQLLGSNLPFPETSQISRATSMFAPDC